MVVFSQLAIAAELYTVHCASYKTQNSADEDVKKLLALGYDAIKAPVDIKDKGKWFRVYAGKFDTKEKAMLAAEEMKRNKIISEYSIFPISSDQHKFEAVKSKKSQTMIKQDKSLIDKRMTQDIEKRVKPEETLNDKKSKDKLPKNSPALLIEKVPAEKQKNEQVTTKGEATAAGSTLFDRASNNMKEKKYEEALATFKEFITRDDTSKELGERALRNMADCHYYLGEKGSKEHLLIAVEFYKNTLQSFPDPKKENALTYFHLAKTYELLKKQPEALTNYEMLLSRYPESAYTQEATFKIGETMYQLGKHSQAADKLIAYLMKYRGGIFTKQAFYLVADCYYKTQQAANAEVWFRDAQKKWPDLVGIPKEVVIDMGQHKYSLRRYDDAINIFSIYVNIYPNDDKLKEVLLMLANSYKDALQVSSALTIYNMIIDKYPESKETRESIISMASLGVDKPGAKIFAALGNIHYYKYPIDAYNTILMKNPTGEIAEAAMLQKGEALHKLKSDRRAADTYTEFMNLHPQSKRIDEARKGLKLTSGTLINDYYQKKDYLAVADIYFKAYRALPLQPEEYATINKVAVSLKEIGLIEDNIKLLKDYQRVCKEEAIAVKVTFDIAEGEMARGKYDEAKKIFLELMAMSKVKNSALVTAIKKNLAEIAYRQGSYDKAVADYGSLVNSGQNIDDPAQTYWRYAASLKEARETNLALQNYLTAVKYLNQDKKSAESYGQAYKEIGDLYFDAKKFQSGLDMYNKAAARTTDPDLKYWSLFLAGQSYSKMDKNNEAQKTFAQIKTESGPEGFWTKVVDYYVDDQKWWDKYGNYIKKQN